MKTSIQKYAGSRKNSPYDELAKYNREYQRLLGGLFDIFVKYASHCHQVADLGCGTGNISLKIYDALKSNPGLTITSCDVEKDMLGIIEGKVAERNLENVISIHEKDITDLHAFPEAAFDAVNITHALNYTRKPLQVLQNIHRWLSPKGILIATDIGRAVVVNNWSKGMWNWVFEDYKMQGHSFPTIYYKTILTFLKNLQARTQNLNFARDQQAGIFPSHSSAEFQTWVVDAGFEIIYFNDDYYRDPVTNIALDDLAVAVKQSY